MTYIQFYPLLRDKAGYWRPAWGDRRDAARWVRARRVDESRRW